MAQRADSRAAIEQRHVGRGSAHVERDKSIGAERPRQARRSNHSRRGAGQNRTHRFRSRQLRADSAAVGLHYAKPCAFEPGLQIFQMRRHPRCDVRIHDRGREALVFAILGENPMRDRERPSQQRKRSCDCLLARRIRVRVKQADGKCLGATAGREPANSRELGAAQRLDDAAVEQRALGDAEAHRALDQRFRPRGRESVQVVAVLAANLDQVFEAGVGEQCDARAFFFKQRVSRDGGTVRNRRGLRVHALEHLAQAANDGVGWVGRRRQHLVHVNFAADDRDEVSEGAAGVDADQYGSRAPPFHDAFNNILKLSGFFAASKAAMPSSSAKVPSISGCRSILPAASASRAG